MQVDLEIQHGSVNAAQLEDALRTAGFAPDPQRVWRWEVESDPTMIVKMEFLTDLDDIPSHQTVSFDDCQSLGAVNLRGTGFAAQDWEIRAVIAEVGDEQNTVELRVATLPAYLLAKAHAAHGRGLTKDWYDIAYVLIHNDDGGPGTAGDRVLNRFADAIAGPTATALSELVANFADATSQGSLAYAETMVSLHTELDVDVLAQDAVAAVGEFVSRLGVEPS